MLLGATSFLAATSSIIAAPRALRLKMVYDSHQPHLSSIILQKNEKLTLIPVPLTSLQFSCREERGGVSAGTG